MHNWETMSARNGKGVSGVRTGVEEEVHHAERLRNVLCRLLLEHAAAQESCWLRKAGAQI